MGEDQFVNPSGPSYLTPKEIDKQIASLTSDPKSAYWDKLRLLIIFELGFIVILVMISFL